MLFMGEEWASRTPFHYFCDFHGDLAQAVREGRKREFPPPLGVEAESVDPNGLNTFAASHLDWDDLRKQTHTSHLAFVEDLLKRRRAFVLPLLEKHGCPPGHYEITDDRGVFVRWEFTDGTLLKLAINASPRPLSDLSWDMSGTVVFAAQAGNARSPVRQLSPWEVIVCVAQGAAS
jgi:1,4-alpha-glucan branching enzyme